MINPALDWLAAMDSTDFKRWFKGSPIERTRRKRFHRNVAIAMGNSGDSRFTSQLQAWAASGDHIVAEAAHWALQRIDNLNPHSSNQLKAAEENLPGPSLPDSHSTKSPLC